MATVPYSGAPSVGPSNQGVGGISGEAPADAFGMGNARAVGELGGALSQSGDVIFGRALAMQELANQSAAREADAKYMIELGKIHAEYNSLQGPEAINQLPKYQQLADKLRADTAKGLNPMARRMYDASARSTMARTLFNWAGHAATENKKWAVQSATAQLDLDAKSVEDDPNDDLLFQDKLGRMRRGVATVAGALNLPPDSPQAQKLLLERTSALWSSRILGLSRTDPDAADRLLQSHKTELTQQDFLRLDQSVRTQARSIGTANLAQEVYDPTKTFEEMQGDIEKKAKASRPNDPLFQKAAVAALRGLYNQNKYQERQQVLTDRQTVAGAIQQGVLNEQQLRADPQVAAAVDRLPKSEQLQIPAQINRYNSARDKQTNQDNYLRLWGMSNNDVTAFLDTDLTKEQLSQGDMRKLLAQQQKLKEVPQGDPRVNRAVGWMRGALGSQLEALGIFRRTKDNATQYDQFTGALQSALDVWQEEKGKPATYQDIVSTIGPAIIQQRSEPWFFGLFPGKRPFYDQDVPQEFSDKIKADVVAKGGVEPTTEQIARAYTRMQYLKLYGSKKDQNRIPFQP